MTRTLLLARAVLSTAILTLLIGAAGGIGDPLTQVYLGLFASLGIAKAFATNSDIAHVELLGSDDALDPSLRVFASFLFLATVTVSAFDAERHHWSPAVPTSLRGIALSLMAVAGVLQTAAMAVNRFFSAHLWLQPGQRLVARGPYRFLRHPGYLAMLITVPATAVALGSLAGLVPALGYEILILRRTLREDRLLRREMGGYAEYAGTVRYRLVPGLW